MASENKQSFLSPLKTPSSIGSAGSPVQGFFKTTLKKQSNTASGPEKFLPEQVAAMYATDSQYYTKGEENSNKESKIDYELIFRTLFQKLGYLESSIKNLVVSSGKLASLFMQNNDEEDMILRVYESDKKSLESSLTSFKGFVMHTYDNIRNLTQINRSKSHNALLKPGKSLVLSKKRVYLCKINTYSRVYIKMTLKICDILTFFRAESIVNSQSSFSCRILWRG